MRIIDAEKLWLTTEYVDGKVHKYYEQFEVDDAPTIDADLVRHGKWIKENIVLTSLPPQYRWHCSECGSIRDGYDGSVLTPYCPHCGAKMDEVNDE